MLDTVQVSSLNNVGRGGLEAKYQGSAKAARRVSLVTSLWSNRTVVAMRECRENALPLMALLLHICPTE